MARFLSYLHHLPSGGKDGFISLLLPKLNVERTIWKTALHQSRLPG
jgi:hypothetical protein